MPAVHAQGTNRRTTIISVWRRSVLCSWMHVENETETKWVRCVCLSADHNLRTTHTDKWKTPQGRMASSESYLYWMTGCVRVCGWCVRVYELVVYLIWLILLCSKNFRQYFIVKYLLLTNDERTNECLICMVCSSARTRFFVVAVVLFSLL